MIRITIALLIIIIGEFQLFQGEDRSQDLSSGEDYFRQNEQEGRLQEYKDSDEDLLLKIKQLEVINRSRKRYRVEPLKLDILACRLANKMCKEAALNDYVGHWNLKGEKPYHRYAFAGGLDHLSENASGQMTSGRFNNSPEAISKRMEEDHGSFMAEKKPNDGHKQTVIDKDQNYVGLGFYASDKQFRYYELYIKRYYSFEDIPSELERGEKFTIKSKPPEGFYFNLLVVYYEKDPSPLSPAQISSRSYYNDYTDEIAYQIEPWNIEDFRTGSWYKFPMRFNKKGLYYIQIFSSDQKYQTGRRFTTEGKLQASGIVIKVE
jgi:hypothetical protein